MVAFVPIHSVNSSTSTKWVYTNTKPCFVTSLARFYVWGYSLLIHLNRSCPIKDLTADNTPHQYINGSVE